MSRSRNNACAQPSLHRSAHEPSHAHGDPRPESPLRHRLVTRQRIGQRPRSLRSSCLDLSHRPTRFIHHEGAERWRTTASTDEWKQPPSPSVQRCQHVVSAMYSPVSTLIEWAKWAETTALDERPLLICEYSHAMGNSNGSLDRYLEAFWQHDAIAGGFVWDWRDQGLLEHDENGRPFGPSEATSATHQTTRISASTASPPLTSPLTPHFESSLGEPNPY